MQATSKHPLSEVLVYPEDHGITRSPGEVPKWTHFYRQDSMLPQVMDAALERHNPQDSFRILSVGSSFGPEVDSLLSIARRKGLGQVAAFGYDISGPAIDAAKEGRYKLTFHDENNPELHPFIDSGFDLQVYKDEKGQHKFEVNGLPLREGNLVTFEQRDFTEGEPPDIGLVDLAVVNNVLFHLSADAARKMVENMAKLLKPGGVLSIGGNLKQRKMNSNSADGYDYDIWRREMSDLLSSVYGMKPIMFDEREMPIVFSRIADSETVHKKLAV